MAFGNVCELKGWKYQSHQIDNLNNSYEIEFWEIGLLHAGFQSVWLWMNDIWVTLESLVVKDSLSRWTQKMGNISPYLHVVTLSFPNTVLWVLWLHFELVISLSVRSWIITEFRTCFIYINMRSSCYILKDCSFIQNPGLCIYYLVLFLGPRIVKKRPNRCRYSHVLLINCEIVRSAIVRLGAVLNYVSIYKTCSGYSESCCRMSWNADKIILIHRYFAYT